MIVDAVPLLVGAPGLRHELTVQRFGHPGARPKVYIQAALHADEIPGMIAAHHLRRRLLALESAGAITGEIVLVPVANPVGLGQRLLGSPIGRFDLSDGLNFNRGYPHFTPAVAARIEGRLGPDETRNAALVREALVAEAAALQAQTIAESLKHALVRLAVDADVVLDLHCDSEAVMHLYTLTSLEAACDPLARLLGAQSVLLAPESGDDPFDEVFSRPWHELRERFPTFPIPLGCFSTTVELRGGLDVSHETGESDAEALALYLRHVGAVAGGPVPLPPSRHRATALGSLEPLTAPHAGILLFRVEAGVMLAAGDVVADIVDPLTGETTEVRSDHGGLLFARNGGRFASAGRRIGKVAGTTLRREGKLLTA